MAGWLQACTPAEVLRASFPSWALPQSGPQLTLLLKVDSCGAAGTLFGFGAVAVLLDCTKGLLTLHGSASGLGTLEYPMPPASANVTILLAQQAQQNAFTICVNSQALSPSGALNPPLLQQLASNSSLLGSTVRLGAASDTVTPAEADVSAFWVSDALLPCANSTEAIRTVAALAAGNQQPELSTPIQTPAGDTFVGQLIQLDVAVVDADGDPVTLRATAYGLPQAGCTQAAECPDTAAQVTGTGQANLLRAFAYSRPGRYVVRVEASDGSGAIQAMDHVVLVRKQNDTAGAAPCCRHSPGIVAQQLGRPTHQTVYRDASVYTYAQTLGWTKDYVEVCAGALYGLPLHPLPRGHQLLPPQLLP